MEQGGGIPDPSSLIPVPSTLPHLTNPSFSAIAHLLHTHCVHRAPKGSLTVLTIITTAFPLAALADRDPNSSAPGSILRAQKPLLKPGMWNLDIWEKYGKPEETGGGEKVGREPHNFPEQCGHLQQQDGLR